MLNSIRTNFSLFVRSPMDYIYSFRYSNVEKIKIKPFNPKSLIAAEEIIKKLTILCPEINIILIGSVGLKIDGLGDIDLYACSLKSKLPLYYKNITKSYGQPVKVRIEYREWKFWYHGFVVELHLTDTNNRGFKNQVYLFNLIKNNQKYLNEYQKIKKMMNKHSMKEYILHRMEFFNRILSENMEDIRTRQAQF
jgi:hypothetical protein